MSDEMKRRLAGVAVLLAVFSMVAVWIGSRGNDSGELPAADAQVRNYDIRDIERIAAAQSGQQAVAEPVPEEGTGTSEEAPPAPVAEPTNEQSQSPVKQPEPVVAKKVETPEPKAVEPKPAQAPKPAPEPVPVKKEKAEANGEWVVQVASVTKESGARNLANKLRGKGWASFVTQGVVKGKTYYRVRVGPYAERSKADSAAARLKKEEGYSAAVMHR